MVRETASLRVLLFDSSITDINACTSQPCANGGSCVWKMGNTYTCNCLAANDGSRCEGAELLGRDNEAVH